MSGLAHDGRDAVGEVGRGGRGRVVDGLEDIVDDDAGLGARGVGRLGGVVEDEGGEEEGEEEGEVGEEGVKIISVIHHVFLLF